MALKKKKKEKKEFNLVFQKDNTSKLHDNTFIDKDIVVHS